jgi:hypothetical protein
LALVAFDSLLSIFTLGVFINYGHFSKVEQTRLDFSRALSFIVIDCPSARRFPIRPERRFKVIRKAAKCAVDMDANG